MIPKYLYDISNNYKLINLNYVIISKYNRNITSSEIYSILEKYKIDNNSYFNNKEYIIDFRDFNKYIFYAGQICIYNDLNKSYITFKYYNHEWNNFIKYLYNLIILESNIDLHNDNNILNINYNNNNHISYLNSFFKMSNIITLYYIIENNSNITYDYINYIFNLLKNKSYIKNTLSLILLNKLCKNNKNFKIIKIIFNNKKNLFKKYIDNISYNFEMSQFNRKLFINLFKFKKKLNNLL